MLLEQVADLVQHRDLTVLPVIDLNHARSVNGYEHPTAVKLRTRLRTVYDVFPHSTSRATSRLDHDHPTPYVPPADGGPPGQTGDHNDAPLTRLHHRAKTHDGYHVRQLALGAYRWVTPHGLARIVTPRGTRKIELIRARDGTITGEIYPGYRHRLPAPPLVRGVVGLLVVRRVVVVRLLVLGALGTFALGQEAVDGLAVRQTLGQGIVLARHQVLGELVVGDADLVAALALALALAHGLGVPSRSA